MDASKAKYLADRHNQVSAKRDCQEFIDRVVLPQVMNAASHGKYETLLSFERCQALAPWTRFTKALADECCARLSTPEFGYEASVTDSAMVVRWSAASAYVPRDGEAVLGYPPLVLEARDRAPVPVRYDDGGSA